MHESRRTDESQKHTKHIEISPASEISGKLNKTKWFDGPAIKFAKK